MGNTILEVENLTRTFTQGKKSWNAVDHISFSIEKGECFGLIGESGSGKSTAANMISGLLKPSGGQVHFHGKNLQMVFQDPRASFSPRMTILDGLCEGLRYRTHMDRAAREKRACEVLEQVGLSPEYGRKYARELSGGECQRAAIGRAIMIQPELLICDEVTSALDVSVQEQIIDLLKTLRKDLGISYLFISHDIALVNGICDRIAVMQLGHIVEMGRTEEIIRHPQELYTRELMASVLSI